MLFDSINPESEKGDGFSFKLTQITAKSKSENFSQSEPKSDDTQASLEQSLSQFDKFVQEQRVILPQKIS